MAKYNLLFPLDVDKISVSSGFGMRVHPVSGEKKLHEAIDLPPKVRGVSGDEVFAPEDGVIRNAKWNASGGYYMCLYSKKVGLYFNFQHLSKYNVKEGATVKRGDIIAFMGNTGSATTGAHLHFAIGTSCSPAGFIPKDTKIALDPMSYLFSWTLKKDSAVSPPQSQSVLYRVKVVASPILNVRADAGTAFTQVDTVKYGSEHDIYEEKTASNGKKWGKIGEGRWISREAGYSEKIQTASTPPPSSGFKVVVTANSLNIRKTGSILGTATGKYVYKNEELVIVQTNGNFGKLADGRGWVGIGSSYVRRV